jgi:hypothetical protein
MPNDRVLSNIKSKAFKYSISASQTLSEDWIDTIDIRNTLTYGRVDFERSNIEIPNGKLYTIIGKTIKKQSIELIIENYDSTVVLREIKK